MNATGPSCEGPPAAWLVRIPEVFAGMAEEILQHLGAGTATKLGSDYFLLKSLPPAMLRESDAAVFVQWNLPVEHSWPCCPQTMDDFIERAAQALLRKFGPRNPQAILTGPLEPGSPQPYYKSLASNLRGRTLQVFPKLRAGTADEQESTAETLFCLVGKEGLFCGMATPRAANGWHPGGTKFISQSRAGTISRAGAKIAEALHWLRLHRPPPAEGSHWLELGASPGGMTSELLDRGFKVTAVDRAPLDPRLNRRPGLTFLKADAATFLPPPGAVFDALLSDLNGDALVSLRLVIRLLPSLRPNGLVVFTLKTPHTETLTDITAICQAVIAAAAAAGLRLIAITHLTYNRQEFTVFWECRF